MKKTLTLLFILFISTISSIYTVNAQETEEQSTEITKQIEISREYVFIYFWEFFKDTPISYKYINLNFKNIKEWSALEHSLKTLVYHDKIDNTSSYLKQSKNMNAYVFYKLSEKILWLEFTLDKASLVSRNVQQKDLNFITETYTNNNKVYIPKSSNNNSSEVLWDKKEMFNDVYESLTENHYDKANIDKEELIYSAIEWMAKWTGDKHTSFFPPVESKNFNENLNWEYEGIWTYVEMSVPGELKITSPIPGWPAEKAWLKWWDIIIKVEDKDVNDENSLEEIISWIKWPAWTTVNLTVLRKGREIEIEVTREKITIKNIDYKKINNKTYYLQLKSFWNGISWEFKTALEEIKQSPTVNKIIIDLRNNGGWYLWEVTEMLSYMVPEGDSTAVVKYNGMDRHYYSKGYDLIDFSDYEIIILQNSGTASASEIMIGTMQDYLDITTIGENTYWKGSVQTVKTYSDGSTFKYTIAKWFTWKTQTWIDWIWIAPDIELELNIEAFKYNWKDNQLDKAIYK